MATIADRLEVIWGEKPGLASWLMTVDHKRIGLRYLYTGIVFFVVGGIEALVLRAQLTQANLDILDPEAYNQMFSMHGTTMMFLFAVPALSGFGNFFVPLMIGSRDMAFPRLNSFGYWALLGSGLFMYSSFLVGSAPDNGWFNYVPLGGTDFTPGVNIDFYVLGLIFLGLSTTGGAINFIVTILKLRAPGMSINRMPIFVWGELALGLAIVFAQPALTTGLVMLELDRKFGFHFFDSAAGGDPVLWQHLFWIFGHPWVYIIVLPAFGLVSMMIPAFSGRRIIGYAYLVVAEMAVALIGFGVWAHHMFAVGIPQIALSFISASSFLVTIPSAIQVFAWLATLVTGRPRLR
jgi:cytochrome c oxidase subunit I+III